MSPSALTIRAGGAEPPAEGGLTGRRWWLACGIVLSLALTAAVPTTGDFGLTWDEPAYRYSQLMSAQWWERLAQARTRADVSALVEPNTLLYYWPYGRVGLNFHPPLAGQGNLLTHTLFGRWMRDIPARRLASVFEYALTITIGFGFLARRYGPWVGGVMAGSLLLMPRVYGDGHIAATDMPGLFLWAATALAFWKGLHEPHARPWRVAVGVLLGLAFLEKMAAVMVLGPLVAWLVVGHLPRTLTRRGGRADWVDGIVTTAAMLVPLGIAALEIHRLRGILPGPTEIDLFSPGLPKGLPGGLLAIPLLIWAARRFLGRALRAHPVWGVERPALETWTAILAFAPPVGWLGNPAWWRETLPRLAHYSMLSTERERVLPAIHILYLGQIYNFSLPWHNAWVLLAVTVPVTILAAATVGLVFALRDTRRDRIPLYFLAHMITLPTVRMFDTPAHDGVRLFLPTFFFLAAFAGWGAVGIADAVARVVRAPATLARALMAAIVLVPAGWQLVKVHPFELSYYNELIGGPRGAWKAGLELAYWWDAFNERTIAELNERLPRAATVEFLNELDKPPTFQELQTLGHLRGDLKFGSTDPDRFPFVWLLTHDSKPSPFTRLLFAMTPWYARAPRQLDGLRVATVADPVAVTRAWALQLLVDRADARRPRPPAAPDWVHHYVPWLGRLWGEGLRPLPRRKVNEALLDWARRDPKGLRNAARLVADRQPIGDHRDALRLKDMLSAFDRPGKPGGLFSERLLSARPEALEDAVEILITRPDAVRTVLTRFPYTDPESIGGYLDGALPRPVGSMPR